MDSLPRIAQEFYENGSAEIQVLRPAEQQLQRSTLFDVGRRLTAADVSRRCDEIVTTSRVISSHGYNFEVAEIDRGQSATAMLHASTYRSSIPNNAGNVLELARRVTRMHTIYVSSFSRGRTSALKFREASFLARNGSLLTRSDGRHVSLRPIVALLAALDSEGIVISDVRSDSSGRLLTDALAFHLPADQLESLYHNAPTGLGRMRRGKLVATLALENLTWCQRMLRDSPDPDRIDDDAIHMAELELDARGAARGSVDDLRLGSASMAIASFLGLAAPIRSISRAPAIRDAVAIAGRHPRARMAYVQGELDPLSFGFDPEDLAAAWPRLAGVQRRSPAFAVLKGMHHNAQTAFPRLYAAIESEVNRF